MKNYLIPSAIATVFLLFSSCRTVEEGSNLPDPGSGNELLSPDHPEEQAADPPDYAVPLSPAITDDSTAPVELPVPKLSLSFYEPQISGAIAKDNPVNPPLPVFHIPEEETPTLAVPEAFPDKKEESAVIPAVKAAPTAAEEVLQTESAENERQAVGESPDVTGEETFPFGEISLVILDGTDWFYLKEKEGADVNFTDRSIMNGKTLFSYDFPGVGTYILLFQRQDHRTGTTERAEILVKVQEDVPAVIPEEEGEDGKETADRSEAVDSIASPAESVVTAEKRLEEIEEDPEKVEETLGLLEFLADAASDDESLAGYYYRMARTLEMNTRFQDLRKAYETYQYIENTFFLTDYYEKAVERIRYLDRHFFKLR